MLLPVRHAHFIRMAMSTHPNKKERKDQTKKNKQFPPTSSTIETLLFLLWTLDRLLCNTNWSAFSLFPVGIFQ